MASTQTLTELPSIHYTGMDYNTVISQIKEIIENNSNWAANWTQFYNSEAGTMLIQLMAWICDTLGVRQDMLYNEMFMATATTDKAKRRLLNLVGYTRQSASAASFPISIQFDDVQSTTINLSNCRDDETDISSIVYNIFKFYGKDINGDSKPFEILNTNSDGTINYTKSVKLNPGLSYYTTDSDGNQLKAVEGTTIYKEFTSDTNDGPSFILEDDNIDLKTLVIYDVTNNQNVLQQRVENFLDLNVLNGTNICYTISVTDDGYYQINYPTLDIVTYGSEKLEDRLFTAGNTIGVLYRTTSGSAGNISAAYISTDETAIDADGNIHNITIENTLAGSGGRDEESLTSALKNYSQSIKTMNRAITITDYETLLKQNNLVLNCKSYSPDNMPSKFKEYFGRRINPQEIFSFVILNKAIENIPSDRLNYFPWIELNKDQVLNEKYVFGDAVLNKPIMATDSGALNIYINSIDNSIDTDLSKQLGDNGSDDGSKFYEHYNFTYNDNTYQATQIPNITLYKTGSIFGEYIKQELANIEMGDSNPCFLKIKFSNTTSSENYIKNMTNGFLGTTENLMTNNNIIEQEVNATYNGSSLISTTDMINYKYIKFVLDDNLKFTINLQAEKESLDISALENNTDYGFLSDDDVSSYYLKFYNSPSSDDILELTKYRSNLEENNTETSIYQSLWNEYKNSKSYANYRKGIVQQIKEQIDDQLNFLGKEIKTGDNIHDGYDVYKNYSRTVLYKKTDTNGTDNYLLTDLSGKIAYSIENSASEFAYTENSDKLLDKTQDVIVRNKLSDGSSAFIDLGLQEPKKTSGDFLFASYFSASDNSNDPLGLEDVRKYYALKVNGQIYALRIDGYTAQLAKNFYKTVSNTTGDFVIYYDYYPYIGAGELVSGQDIKTKLENACGSDWVELIKNNHTAFSRENISSNVVTDDYQTGMIKTEKQGQNSSSEASNAYVSFSIEQLAATLEYLVSIFNDNEDTVYKFENGQWVDIKKDNTDFSTSNILDGKMRIACIEKANFSNSHCLSLPLHTENEFENGKEYDIRFECFNMDDDELEISSVKENDIKVDGNIITINEENVEDLIQNIFGGYLDSLKNVYKDTTKYTKYYGLRRKYIGEKTNYVEAGADGIFSYGIADEDGESGYIYFKSLKTGRNSSIYFIQTADGDNYEFMSYSGLFHGFSYSNNIVGEENEYIDRARSEKALGIKRVELITSEDILSSYYGVDNEVLSALGKTGNNSEFANLETGDIIITDNDINHTNLSTLYFSYILSDVSKIALDQRNNFYYSSDDEITEGVKPPIVCIEGAAVEEDEEGNYYIDKNKSNFDVRLTAEEQDTNSLYAITQDTYAELKTLKVDRVFVETNTLTNIDTNNTTIDGYNPYYSVDGMGYGFTDENLKADLKTVEDYEVPLIYSIDGNTNNIATEIDFDYDQNQNSVIAVNPGKLSSLTGSKLMNNIQSVLKASDNYSEDYFSMVEQSINNSNRFILYGLLPTGDGNITFYYPASALKTIYKNSEAKDQGDNDDLYGLACKIFYLHLFGTSKTNPDFYALYPQDDMTSYGINQKDVVQTISNDEYFYCPTKKHPLKFVYRNYISDDKSESTFGDYYITAESKNSSDENFKVGYYFYLNKTPYANFPDTNFYVHFINDRTYEYDRTSGKYQTEEDILNNYMNNYKITGMDNYFLKPYFKTFDIVGTINYNSNYDVSTIKQTIESKLKAKYAITNIKDFVIGQDIYRSDIFKILLSVEGVESAQLEYFGYNYTDQTDNPDQKYVLTTGTSDSTTSDTFYIIPVLHDSSSNRGIVLTYNRVATSSIYSN